LLGLAVSGLSTGLVVFSSMRSNFFELVDVHHNILRNYRNLPCTLVDALHTLNASKYHRFFLLPLRVLHYTRNPFAPHKRVLLVAEFF
jgi:hypothetical protein